MRAAVEGVVGAAAGMIRAAVPSRWTPPVVSTARWSGERARSWSRTVGWLSGCNFIPSSAGNQLEMWQGDTFDPDTNDRELRWAAGLGFNSVRVFLHDLAWSDDPGGFTRRFETFLDIADSHGISVMPVLFDGVWDPNPRIGPQREPRPGTHNSIWLQSPGAAALTDRSQWARLADYVSEVIGTFGRDPRVVVWDLFNEPDNPNVLSYPAKEARDKHRHVTELLQTTFDKAESIDPDQPLTAGVFIGVSGSTERVSDLNRLMLGRSEVISFHCYGNRRALSAVIDHLSAYQRPLLCTEWMGRPRSPVDLIELLGERSVASYCWGLVDGRSQTRFPWTSWVRPTPAERPWFHDLLHSDGSPYSEEEARLIRGTCARYGTTERGDGSTEMPDGP